MIWANNVLSLISCAIHVPRQSRLPHGLGLAVLPKTLGPRKRKREKGRQGGQRTSSLAYSVCLEKKNLKFNPKCYYMCVS